MSRHNRDAQRQAFRLVPETCPHVDAALADAASAIKEQTNALRDALVSTLDELLEAREIIDDLERQVSQLQDELQNAREHA